MCDWFINHRFKKNVGQRKFMNAEFIFINLIKTESQ